MTLLPDYAYELGQAGNRLAARSARRRRRARLTMVVVLTLVVLGAIAAGATTFWNPPLGDNNRGRPVASRSAPPSEQLALFGALRREPTAEDRGVESRYALSMFTPKGISGIRTDHVRLLGTFDNDLGVVLVPAQRAGEKRDVLCLWMRDPDEGGGWSCYTTDEIMSGNGFVGMGGPKAGTPATSASRITIAGLVPDNVTRVRSGMEESAVKDNLFLMKVPVPTPATGPLTVTWLSSTGAPVEQRDVRTGTRP